MPGLVRAMWAGGGFGCEGVCWGGTGGTPQAFVPPFALFLLCTEPSSNCLSIGEEGGGQESLHGDTGATSS